MANRGAIGLDAVGLVAVGLVYADSGAAVPALTSVTGTVRDGASLTLTGTDLDIATDLVFRTSSTTYSQAQTISTQSATEITLTLDRGNVPLSDSNHTIEFWVNSAGGSDTLTVSHVGPSGWSLTTTSGTQVEAGDGTSLHDFIAGTAAAGEQFSYQTPTSGDSNTDTWAVTVAVDGTFSVAGGVGHDTFQVQHWRGSDGWGAVATVHVYDTIPTLGIAPKAMHLRRMMAA